MTGSGNRRRYGSRRPPDFEPRTNYTWNYTHSTVHKCNYTSLVNAPPIPKDTPWVASIYRGLVPAKCILNRDFAINGATVSFVSLSAHRDAHARNPVYSSRLITRIFLRSPRIQRVFILEER